MRRRTVLALLAATAGSATAGCVSGPGDTGAPGGDPPTDTTTEPDATTTITTTTDPDTTTTETTETTTTTPECTPVETDFSVPDVSKPSSLDTESAVQPVAQLEEAYEETLDISPETFPEVPDDARLNQFGLYRRHTDARASGDAVVVTVGGVVRYSYDGSEPNTTEYHADRPIDVATYRVTTERIRRESGVGDLTGTLVCW